MIKFKYLIEEITKDIPSSISVNGKSRPTLNSNGNLIANTEEAIVNFWKWFGDSKVVDSKGRPLVLYHGTRSTFDTFKPSKSVGNQGEKDQIEGMYFTDNIDGAKFFSANDNDPRYLKAVYLSMQNPYISEGIQELKDSLHITLLADVSNIVKKLGYDGLMITRGFYAMGGPHKKFITFLPNQIKSIKNNDTYNPSSNKITEDLNSVDYSSWKRKNVTLRGMKSIGVANEVYGSFGKGLYTVPLSNKAMARTYGTVYFVVNAIPKKPKIVDSLNSAELVRQNLINSFCKKNNVDYNPSYFESNTNMETEMGLLGFDGLIIKGREMVNYNPPKDVRYFKTEDELENYYTNTVQ